MRRVEDYSINTNDFKKMLIEKKYPKSKIRLNTCEYEAERYSRIEIVDNEYVIQAFVLMPKELKEKKRSYPFYRSYSQKNFLGTEVKPACVVAVRNENENKWVFYGAKDFRLYNEKTTVNYYSARRRFYGRPGAVLLYSIRRSLFFTLIAFILYFVLYVLSLNGLLGKAVLPFDGAIVSMFIAFAVFSTLPPLIPYIKGIKNPWFIIDLKGQDKER